ncbi:hypothetical protein [Nonomuraea cavernae]|uniref:SAVED domain-containing protein n=1 Tax=Nonomuraea cavernae TaxID=2045107 RepID=A0A918DJW0_9ACTN|nr:hypothetical protein [Nonomuraea cavernae]MCA2186457.1 hypothetical protein [Nonomuraea cavernae]GGO71140.1 hypothetical protein GCM10012289_36170 [Nonomuraea cavernae]
MGRSRGRAKVVVEGASRWTVAALAGVAAAVAAGTVPDVIKSWLGDQRAFLTVLCVVAAAVFAGINLWQQRSKGVGIVIALPRKNWRASWSEQWSAAAVAHARRHHDSCFVVRRDVEGARPDDDMRARKAAREARKDTLELAYELVNARLTELSEADPSTPISLYVNAALPDAFELGAMFKFNVHRRLHGVAAFPARERTVTGEDEPAVPFVLPQRAELAESDFFPAVRISGRLKDPLSPAEAVRAAKIARVVEEPEFPGAADGEAVALVVHLAENPRMVAEALRAAAEGCLDVELRQERCRAALVIDGVPANIPETTADFELIVRYVHSAWLEWVAARPQLAGLRVRLFVAAPASVVFALGWLMGHTITPVPHPYEQGEPCTSS